MISLKSMLIRYLKIPTQNHFHFIKTIDTQMLKIISLPFLYGALTMLDI